MGKQIVQGNKTDWEFHGNKEFGGHIEKCLLPEHEQYHLIIPNKIDEIDIVSIESEAFCKSKYEVTGPYDDPYFEETLIANEDLYELVVSEGIKEIGNAAFKNCTKLKSVSLPEGLQRIGEECFEFCEALETINLPGTVVSLGRDCFTGCKKLSTLIVPSSLESLGDSFKFSDFSVDTLILSEGIKIIEDYTFLYVNAKSILLPQSLTHIEGPKALPSPSTGVVLFCYPGSYGLIYARQNGYKVANAAF